MKQILLLAGLAFALASCNNETKDAPKEGAEPAPAAAAAVDLPFKLDKPYKNWQMATDNNNTIAAMAALKAFVDKDYTALAAAVGDSIELRFDNYQAKVSRDSAMSFFKNGRAMYSEISITMYDYESVISADKEDEWVTIWYKQDFKDPKGVADSLAVINDIKMKNGKLVTLDEKVQRYQVKK